MKNTNWVFGKLLKKLTEKFYNFTNKGKIMKLTRNFVLTKINEVVDSCKTIEQTKVAGDYLERLKRKFISQLKDHSVYDTYDRLTQKTELSNYIYNKIIQKQKDLIQ